MSGSGSLKVTTFCLDGSTVGPETLLGTQAGLREDIMSGLMVMGIGHLRAIAVQERKEPRDRKAGPL